MAEPRNTGITRGRLCELLEYYPETGVFIWRIRPLRSKIPPGTVAGAVFKNGYRYIHLDGTSYRAIRLAWLYAYGDPLPREIDHINGVKSDDRLCNLRAATAAQNQANRSAPSNNTSGVKGVRWEASRQRWRAQIMVSGRAKNLGRFHTKEEAIDAYNTAAVAAFGNYAKVDYVRFL